jgi:hypothetical protein
MDNLQKITKRTQIGQIISQLENPIGCEIGVREGKYFNFLYTPNVKEMYAIDIWKDTGNFSQNDLGFTQEQLDTQFKNFCEKYKSDEKVKVIRDYSVNASKQFEDNFFDFIYIDADHSYDGVIADLRSWYPKLKPGGLMGGHDYKKRVKKMRGGRVVRYGVIQAVQDFIKENPSIKIHVTKEKYASYFFIK